jgi:cyclopropane-fatty-acyl-phospholipid synthase
MNSTTASRFQMPSNAPATARSALKLLQKLRHDALTVQFPDGSMHRFGDANAEVLHATLMLKNWNVFAAALKSGDIGFAESYIAGDWSTPSLTDLIKVFISNRAVVEEAIYGTWTGRLFFRIKHLLNRNSKANSKKNIHAHYDLGNAFYELWLDDTKNYSSALFETVDGQHMDHTSYDGMVQAQHAKVRRALSMAGVQTGSRVLEVGCGWGALAEMATTEFAASVVGVTLSTEQLAFANARMAKLGTSELADLRLQDYRDIGTSKSEMPDETFDAIVSIEMVEAVGQAYWPTYFQTLHRLLKPDGRVCIQSIVIDDALFDRYVGSTDFIQQYIFPGGCLPCPREFKRQAALAGFKVVDEFAFGMDYAHTLRLWRDKFLAEKPQVLALGFDERFIRIWEFYLAYCEAAFAKKNTDVVQFTLQKI